MNYKVLIDELYFHFYLTSFKPDKTMKLVSNKLQGFTDKLDFQFYLTSFKPDKTMKLVSNKLQGFTDKLDFQFYKNLRPIKKYTKSSVN